MEQVDDELIAKRLENNEQAVIEMLADNCDEPTEKLDKLTEKVDKLMEKVYDLIVNFDKLH